MQRVLVIGICGAGKSTFSRALAAKTGLPLVHLDTEFWRPGWEMTPREEWCAKVAELVARERWIIDGSYGSSLDLRLPRADTVVWFDYPRLICLWRASRRVLTTYGRVRPDLAPGCPEQFDLEFLRYIWDFNAKSRPQIVTALRHHYPREGSLAVVRRDRDATRLLAEARAS